MAFARGLPFANRWAKQTDFAALPERKDAGTDAGAMAHGPGGLLATPGLGVRKPRKGRKWGQRLKDYSAHAGQTIQGNLGRSQTGQFTRVGAPSSDAPPDFRHAAKKPKRARGRKAGAKKPKKVAQTPEQKRAARAAEHAQNQANVLSSLNIAPDGQQALAALRNGQQPDPQALARGGFVQAGLVEQARDGSYRMTASGRAALQAAAAGDAGRAGSIISSARDRASARTERTQAAAQRQQERATRRAQAQTRREAKRKKMTTKAWNGRAWTPITKSSAPPGDYLIVEDPQKSTTWHLQVKRNGTPDHGLMGGAWAALHGGYRGNKYEGPGKAEAIAKLKRLYAAEKMDTPAEKSFIVFKDAAGHDRWLARTTTAYRDRDGEIISEAALDTDSQRMTATKQFGPLRWWHVGDPDPAAPAAPWGIGLDIGDCDYSTVIGRTRVESGTFRDPVIAQKMAAAADGLEMSPGFFHPLDQPDSAGVFGTIRTFERSVVPIRYGRASNLFTGFTVKEFRMDVDEMERRFKAMYTELGLTPEQAQQFGAQLVQTEKAAAAQKIAFKDAEYPDVVINGVTYKAAPPMATAAPMDAEDDPALGGDSGVDEAVEGEPSVDGGMDGDYIGDMTWDEFAAKLSELLAPIAKMQDMHKSMTDALGEMKAMYGGVATKEAGQAAELVALKMQYRELADKIAQIEGDQPATILPEEVAAALKSAGPTKPAVPDDPAKQAALNDPSRPFAWLGMQTFPELYQNGENT